MTKKSEVGKLGEDIACEYLLNKSFTIIERNFRKPWGELDIITKSPNGVLVFVEVKTIRQYGHPTGDLPKGDNVATYSDQSIGIAELLPEENLTAAKLRKLQRTAYLYAGFNEDLIDDNKGWRIDLVAITINEFGTNIKHFENL